jgi:hypothetical protein
MAFDAYYSDVWRSSDAGSNVWLYKVGDKFIIAMDFGNAQGAATLSPASAGQRMTIGSTETVLNEHSGDYDFRVESNGQTHALMVNAGNDAVGILCDPSGTWALEVNGAVQADDYYSGDGTQGATGSFEDKDGNTVTVKDGLITAFS